MSDWICRNYGRKQGLLRSLYHSLMDSSGQYTRLGSVDWGRVERLVFVCQGNICRSAYAEARARSLGIAAISFGLRTSGGDEPPPSLLQSAAAAGLDLSHHRSQAAAAVTRSDSDLILAMEPAHLKGVRRLSPAVGQVTLLGLWCRHRRPLIQDPYGLSSDYFRTCLRVIDEAIVAVAGRLDAVAAGDSNLARAGAAEVRHNG